MADNNIEIDLHTCRYCNKYIVRLNKVVYFSCGEAYHPSCADRSFTTKPGVYRCYTSRGGLAIRPRPDRELPAILPNC